jgi:predicted  nucleic acid-binding Zn-ribbon protein
MATAKNKATEAEYSMEEKIKALYELQQIDSKIDEINKVKGELPLEVRDLEDEIAGLNTRIDNINAEIEEFNQLTRQRKREVTEAKALIERYEEQQNNVRNNREFDALSKEIEFQKLEIELANKRLKEYAATIKIKKTQSDDAKAIAEDRALDLAQKRSELASIEEETTKDIEALKAQEAEAQKKIDDRMLAAYSRIRGNMRNGLAVVTVKRDACGGCFNHIPPQRQVDIRQNKKIIICEYCGRILVADPTNPAE